MNKTVLRIKRSPNELKRLAVLVLLLTAAGASYGSESTPVSHKDTIRSIQVNQIPGSKKYKIRLYPDAKHQVLFFSASGEERKVYQLYMFDMEGKLVNQTSIRNRETTVLTNIAEGNYLFEVFSNDQRIVNGQLTVN